jgi:uncharacterized membrane protein
MPASYLAESILKIGGNPQWGLCTFTDTLSCDRVLASEYAEIAGIPVAPTAACGYSAGGPWGLRRPGEA